MKKTKKFLSLVLAFMMCMTMMVGLTGCGEKPEDAVVEMFNNYAAAITAEDIDAYMACIDKGSADINIESIKATMAMTFSNYDLKVSIADLKINEFDAEKGVATVVATIEYLNAGSNAYIDNRVTGEYSLVNKDGQWVITNSVMQSVEYLDGVEVSESDMTYTVPDEPQSSADNEDVSSDSEVTGNDALAAEPNTEAAVG